MRRALVLLTSLTPLLGAGCGLFSRGPSTTKPGAEESPMVIFCADTDPLKNPGLDGVASALNDALRGRFAGGARVSPVNIADARAVVEECNGPVANVKCWNALAQLNHAAQVMVPDLSADHEHAVSVVLTLYDAQQEKVVRTSQRTFKDAAAAQSGVGELVAQIAPGGSGG